MAYIKVRDDEGFEQALRRFKKQVEKMRILSEIKLREHFEKPSIKEKRKTCCSAKKIAKKIQKGFRL